MSHPLDEVEDSEWGREQERRHVENVGRFTRIDAKLEVLDAHIEGDIEMHRRFEAKLARLDERTGKGEALYMEVIDELKGIRADTQSIVLFSKGASAVKKFLIWAAPIAAALVSAYVTWTLKK